MIFLGIFSVKWDRNIPGKIKLMIYLPLQTGASPATKDHGIDQDHPGGVIIHTVPEENKSRWSHIDDLDSFFKNVYTYHQKSGFKVMFVQVKKTSF